MMKLAACIEYAGTNYCGWQRLSHATAVQNKVEAVLSKVANEPIEVTCAGRTDSGVHAFGQVIHFETNAVRATKGWMLGCNSNLPDDIAVRWIQTVDEDFHARFSATSREYRYVILNHRARPAILDNKVGWVYHELDAEKMHEAAQALLGEQNFSSFRASGCQAKHAMRNVELITVHRSQDFIYIDIKANAFLHHMVRNIVGSLILVGQGGQSIGWMGELLRVQNRNLAGPTAAASGLYFVRANYPENFALPNERRLPVFG
ncbi:MAG: tRNA pseudouridine synthase A (EC [uncultured Thiotrichaceae bacterium]|uniref:tRNA pseudouridine synthase A n=1 Tax=uncultured Thiotrichaceae bacterium TaxID=298394 RepID=A0A6S6SMT0_9GAMM|nr:MAG: tRNA pseudouridine synthase A (EC [uncultured Thiotrichaceae bacterium]